jgi:chromosome segregation ATPase
MSTYKSKTKAELISILDKRDALIRTNDFEINGSRIYIKQLEVLVERRRVCLTNAVNSKYKLIKETADLREDLSTLKGWVNTYISKLKVLRDDNKSFRRELEKLKEENKNLLHSLNCANDDLKMMQKSFIKVTD